MNIIKAVKSNSLSAVTNALNEGYNVNVASIGPLPPLAVAVTSNCKLDIVKKLVYSGAHIDDALLLACTNGSFEVFEELVKAGGNVNVANSMSIPLLHLACPRGAEFVKLLLLSGANPNITCSKGKTPLHAAVEQKCEPEVFKLLFKFKADPSTKNQFGLTAEEVALTNGFYVIQRLIMSLKKNNPFPKGGKRKKYETEIFEKLDKLQCAEKKLKSAHKTVNTLRKKLDTADDELAKNNKACIELRKELAMYLEETDVSKTCTNTSRTLSECPICLVDYTPQSKVFQCPEGHLMCEKCKNMQSMKLCPQCLYPISNLHIRNRALEEMIRQSLGKSK
ncbi:ankyrin repeat and EF-hand domain-containing protein 1-like [Hydractinia symbiolongicarpus]|uniref:ankyrin repeat and EF-hand domain-containing protein 1-like n=1 Tax=Hydractinia symbiolongicarpus TaxID=13093 RepID=UPI00254A4C47|nr:ankyrin repeat and EF-hand domain-containing protein 1-like [Hydractinia symbiolongicarpus]